MKFKITKPIFDLYPNLTVGVLVVRNSDNKVPAPEVNALLKEEEEKVRKIYTIDSFRTNPKIVAWRNAYKLFGAKPKEHRSSVENLYATVLKGNQLRSINTLVDLYNVVSLRFMLPVGGEDLNTLEGDVELTRAGEHEPSLKLLGDNESKSPKPGEVIYKDGISAICRRFNWREAERSKLTEHTTDCILVIESILPSTHGDVFEALSMLQTLINQWCGGEIYSMVLDNDRSSFEF